MSENKAVTGETCACGSRPSCTFPVMNPAIDFDSLGLMLTLILASCTCEKAEGIESALEVDFTTRA